MTQSILLKTNWFFKGRQYNTLYASQDWRSIFKKLNENIITP